MPAICQPLVIRTKWPRRSRNGWLETGSPTAKIACPTHTISHLEHHPLVLQGQILAQPVAKCLHHQRVHIDPLLSGRSLRNRLLLLLLPLPLLLLCQGSEVLAMSDQVMVEEQRILTLNSNEGQEAAMRMGMRRASVFRHSLVSNNQHITLLTMLLLPAILPVRRISKQSHHRHSHRQRPMHSKSLKSKHRWRRLHELNHLLLRLRQASRSQSPWSNSESRPLQPILPVLGVALDSTISTSSQFLAKVTLER